MKVLITGAIGQLGSDLVSILSREFEVYATRKEDLNISDVEIVNKHFEKNQFDVVINGAAFTDVAKCETEYDKAFRVNALGPRNLAVASEKYGFKLIHISSDYVFSGDNEEGYYEYDRANPINKYGWSKFCGEEYIKNHCCKFFIVRTSWLYGKHGNNFVKAMLKQSETNQEIRVVNDQIGSPTYTVDLVSFIAKVLVTEKYGIYHFSNSGNCNWTDFAKQIFELTGKDIKVIPISTEEYKSPALRPKYSILINHVGQLEFNYSQRNWKDALQDYLSDLDMLTKY